MLVRIAQNWFGKVAEHQPSRVPYMAGLAGDIFSMSVKGVLVGIG